MKAKGTLYGIARPGRAGVSGGHAEEFIRGSDAIAYFVAVPGERCEGLDEVRRGLDLRGKRLVELFRGDPSRDAAHALARMLDAGSDVAVIMPDGWDWPDLCGRVSRMGYEAVVAYCGGPRAA
ncbi:MAG: hypothetical protein LBG62_01400 [Candidatus Methanoplasma sp.]|jgi:hypothetical protein|nr:hypothetical protein [Candidatus Methanoplasma sp.]